MDRLWSTYQNAELAPLPYTIERSEHWIDVRPEYLPSRDQADADSGLGWLLAPRPPLEYTVEYLAIDLRSPSEKILLRYLYDKALYNGIRLLHQPLDGGSIRVFLPAIEATENLVMTYETSVPRFEAIRVPTHTEVLGLHRVVNKADFPYFMEAMITAKREDFMPWKLRL